MTNGLFGVAIRHSLLDIRLLISMRLLSRERKIVMTCFCILEKKNHRIFKLRQHRRSALAATHPEAARGGKQLRNRVLRRANRQ
jgi:hypothetical protein